MYRKPQKEGNSALSIVIVVQLKPLGSAVVVLLMVSLPAWFEIHRLDLSCYVLTLNSTPIDKLWKWCLKG